MQIFETTKPVQRTFDFQGINAHQLKVLRMALNGFITSEEADRESQNQYKQSIAQDIATQGGHAPFTPVPMSLEEQTAREMLEGIRHVERSGLVPQSSTELGTEY